MDDAPIIGPEFFDVRYAAGKMPWDFGGVPKSLKVFLDTHHKSGRVLIPGSGSGYEIEAFSSSGWDVDRHRFQQSRRRTRAKLVRSAGGQGL